MAATPTTELEAIAERLPADLARRLVFGLGAAPVEIIAVRADGEQIRIKVKQVDESDKQKERWVAKWRPSIEKCLKDIGMPLSRKQLAIRLNGGDPRGPFGQAIACMVKSGLLIEDKDRDLTLAGNTFEE